MYIGPMPAPSRPRFGALLCRETRRGSERFVGFEYILYAVDGEALHRSVDAALVAFSGRFGPLYITGHRRDSFVYVLSSLSLVWCTLYRTWCHIYIIPGTAVLLVV